MDEDVNKTQMQWVENMVEPMARMLAAEKMGLSDENYGGNLPDELWEQCVPHARHFLGLE